jgi:hypothetical protein
VALGVVLEIAPASGPGVGFIRKTAGETPAPPGAAMTCTREGDYRGLIGERVGYFFAT